MLKTILLTFLLISVASAEIPLDSPAPAPVAPGLPPAEVSLFPSSLPSPEPMVSTRKVAVVLINGGYNSCAGSVPTSGEIAETNYLTTVGDKAMEYIVQPLKNQDYEVYWVISCFWGSSSYTLQVKASTNPTRANIIPWSSTVQWSPDPQMFYSYLSTFAQTYMSGAMAELRLILVGHSNGGFTMLKLAEQLADSVTISNLKNNTDTRLVAQVHTLDPISVECSPSSIALGFGTMPAPCLRAPTSTEVNYTKIRDEFDVLDNYYQTDYSTLHSGTISLATGNTLVSLPGTQNSSNNAHTRVTSHGNTWENIRSGAVP